MQVLRLQVYSQIVRERCRFDISRSSWVLVVMVLLVRQEHRVLMAVMEKMVVTVEEALGLAV